MTLAASHVKCLLNRYTSFGTDWFNADDRAAELNGGSYKKIPKGIRVQVNLEFQEWIREHIEARKSFAIETTLRTPITFEQTRLAHECEFRTTMRYVSAGSVEESINRVIERAYRGGHSASERLIREIYCRSTRNLLTALDFAESKIEIVRVYDSSRFGEPVRKLMTVQRGRISSVADDDTPPWLDYLLKGAELDMRTRKSR
jgi:predicted ABC-type ATPase